MTASQEATPRRVRLVLLTSLTCNIAWVLAHLYMVLPLHSKAITFALAIMICLSVGSTLKSAWKLYVGSDLLSITFQFVASFMVFCALLTLAFILLLPKDRGADLSGGMAILLMSGLFIGAGSLLAVSPRFAEEALGKLRAPALVKRLAGIFLIAVGCFCLAVPVGIARDLLQR